MKKRYLIIASAIIFIVIIAIASIYDVHFQIHEEFNKMMEMSKEDLSKIYGSDVAALFSKYQNEGFDKPQISYAMFEDNTYMVDLTTYKYSHDNETLGSVLDTQSTSLYFEFDRIPIINFDKLKEITTRVEFETIVMYDAFKEFINKSKDSKNDIDILYKEIILDPMYEEFVSGGEYAGLADSYIGRTMTQHDDLEFKLGLLKDENVEKIVNEALLKSNECLTGIDTTVYIFPSSGDYDYMTDPLGGVTGCTLGSGKILILVDPTADNWESLLSYTVAHEYHHSIWTSQKSAGSSFTLLDYLIFEGRADSFANIVFPEVVVPWISSIDLTVENTMWELINDQLNSSNQALLYAVMFGGITDYPQWSGYTIGYHIVQDYIVKNPEDTIAIWTKMSSSDILEKSGYVQRQN